MPSFRAVVGRGRGGETKTPTRDPHGVGGFLRATSEMVADVIDALLSGRTASVLLRFPDSRINGEPQEHLGGSKKAVESRCIASQTQASFEFLALQIMSDVKYQGLEGDGKTPRSPAPEPYETLPSGCMSRHIELYWAQCRKMYPNAHMFTQQIHWFNSAYPL